MREKLTPYERRKEILIRLVHSKKETVIGLAEFYNVSENTIRRDIDFLSKDAPIYTKSGYGGGIYIKESYKIGDTYLTEKEEHFLFSLIELVNEAEQDIIKNIILKFTMPKV